MTFNYKTSYFARDTFWLFDFIYSIFRYISISYKKFIDKLFEADFELVLLTAIKNIPILLYFIFLSAFLGLFLYRVTENDSPLKIVSITTNSMSPSILPGSLVFIYPANKYENGQVISFREKTSNGLNYTGRFLIHRIIKKEVDGNFYTYTTKGDNNEFPDPGIIKTTDISGKVIFTLPIAGYIDYLTHTLPGFIVLIFIPTTLLVTLALKSLLNEGLSTTRFKTL